MLHCKHYYFQWLDNPSRRGLETIEQYFQKLNIHKLEQLFIVVRIIQAWSGTNPEKYFFNFENEEELAVQNYVEVGIKLQNTFIRVKGFLPQSVNLSPLDWLKANLQSQYGNSKLWVKEDLQFQIFVDLAY